MNFQKSNILFRSHVIKSIESDIEYYIDLLANLIKNMDYPFLQIINRHALQRKKKIKKYWNHRKLHKIIIIKRLPQINKKHKRYHIIIIIKYLYQIIIINKQPYQINKNHKKHQIIIINNFQNKTEQIKFLVIIKKLSYIIYIYFYVNKINKNHLFVFFRSTIWAYSILIYIT